MTETKSIDLGYKPREYQRKFHVNCHNKRYAILIMARQHGKSTLAMYELLDRALKDRTRSDYCLLSPTINQGRKGFWSKLKSTLQPMLELCDFKEQDLICTLPNKSRIFILGAENENARGNSFKGIVVDEFDNVPTDIWNRVFLPTLVSYEEEAWVIYIGTLSTNSKLWKLVQQYKDHPDWYCQITKASEANFIKPQRLERMREQMGENAFQLELECNPHGAPEHSVLGDLLLKADREQRIESFAVNSIAELWSSWDIGIRDYTSIWVFQVIKNHIYYIGYHEYSGLGLPDIINTLKSSYANYTWHRTILPHDIAVRDYSTGNSRLECFEGANLGSIEVSGKTPQAESIYHVRSNLPRCYFHSERCELGLNRLRSVEYAVDPRSDTMLQKIQHNDSSHCFDALKIGATLLETWYPSSEGFITAQKNQHQHAPKVIRCGAKKTPSPQSQPTTLVGEQAIFNFTSNNGVITRYRR